MAARLSKGAKKPVINDSTMQYMKETLELLSMPSPISPRLPPLDLTGWKASATLEISEELLDLAVQDNKKSHKGASPMEDVRATSPQPLPKESAKPPAKSRPPYKDHFSKEKLQKMLDAANARGRKLKHSGDAVLKYLSDYSVEEAAEGLVQSADSLLLYMFSFWCDDLLHGRQDEKGHLTKPACKFDNWKSMFGLMEFVRSRAEKIQWNLLASLLRLMEALILRHLAVNERRALHGTLERQLADNSGVSTSHAEKSYSSFLHYSSEVERFVRLFGAARDVVTLPTLKRELPAMYQLCIESEAERHHVFEPCAPWSFAFALDTNGGYAAIGQAVCFGRALIECLAVQHNLKYRPEWDVIGDM